MSTDTGITGPQYHPRSVTMHQDAEGVWVVTDASRNDIPPQVYRTTYKAQALHVYTTRRATIKAALTRRANKARAEAALRSAARTEARLAACAEAGVTWDWLRSDLTVAEADAWLGLDS